MRIPYRKVTGANGISTLTFDAGVGDFKTVTSAHPYFQTILDGLEAGDRSVLELADVGKAVASKFRQITDRVSYDGVNIFWDGDVVHSALTEHLMRAIEGGEPNVVAIAKFWEKLESNPSEHSRQQAYNFLTAHSFKITEDGDVVGYKGLYSNGDELASTTSSVTGGPSAWVNGEPLPPRSVVTQKVGDVVTLPRSEVMHDPNEACARGLHVSTYDYARGYGNAVAEVHFNPRDMVSVPNDGRGAKVRVCRYKVARIITDAPTNEAVLKNSSWAGDVGYQPSMSRRSQNRNSL